ncbi:unnamed protein product [Lampetra fluviatilis]
MPPFADVWGNKAGGHAGGAAQGTMPHPSAPLLAILSSECFFNATCDPSPVRLRLAEAAGSCRQERRLKFTGDHSELCALWKMLSAR